MIFQYIDIRTYYGYYLRLVQLCSGYSALLYFLVFHFILQLLFLMEKSIDYSLYFIQNHASEQPNRFDCAKYCNLYSTGMLDSVNTLLSAVSLGIPTMNCTLIVFLKMITEAFCRPFQIKFDGVLN